MEKLAVSIGIGAVLTGAFNHAVTTAPKKLAKIGDALAAVKNKDTKLRLFEGAEANLEKSRAKLQHISAELLRVKAAMRGADGKELATLKTRAASLASQQTKLSASVERGRDQLRQAAAAHREAASAADAHRQGLGKLGASFEKMQAQQIRLQNATSAHEASQSKFAAARAKLFMPVALATGLGAAIKGAGQFQSVLTDIAITADLPKEKIAEIGRTLGELASQTGQTRAELAEGFNVLVTAGMDEDAASKVIKTVGLTATAAGAEIGEVARTMYATVNNLKLNPEESLKAMDMLVAAGKEGSFELRDMSKYFPAMTAGASKLGMTGTRAVATLGASLQVAMDGAADPSQAATNMENFMNSLTSPETVKRFEQQGVNLEARFKRWQEKGLDPIEQSMKLIQTMTDGDSFRIGELFGNKRVLSFITPMMAGMEKYKKIRAEVAAAEGMVSADAERRMREDPAFAFKRMGDALVQLRDAAIVPLIAPMGSLFAGIVNLIAPVTRWMTANKELVGGLGKTFAALLGGKLAFAGVAFGIAAVRRAWTALGVIMTGSPLMIAIKALAMGAMVIWSNWEPISTWFSGLWGGIKAGAAWCRDSIKAIWSGVTWIFSSLWDGVAAVTLTAWRVITAPIRAACWLVETIWSGIKAFFSWLWGDVSGETDSAWSLITAPIRLAWGVVQGIWSGASAVFSGIWNGIGSAASAAWDGIQNAASAARAGIDAVWSGVTGFFSGVWEGVSGAASSAWDAVSGATQWAASGVQSAWSGTTEFFSGLWGGISSTASNIWNGVTGAAQSAREGIDRKWADIEGFFGGIWQEVSGAFDGGMAGIGQLLEKWSPIAQMQEALTAGLDKLGDALPDSFKETGKQMMDGLVDGIQSMSGAIGSAISNVASSTVGWFKDKLGIKSPSRVFMGLGGMVGEGAALGIGGMAREVGHAAAKLGTAATLAFAPNLTPSFAASPAPFLPAPSLSALVLPAPSLPATSAPSVAPIGQADILPANRPAAAVASATAAPAASAPAAPVQPHIVFNITQQAGESGEALARRVADLLRRQSRQTRHGALGDWA